VYRTRGTQTQSAAQPRKQSLHEEARAFDTAALRTHYTHCTLMYRALHSNARARINCNADGRCASLAPRACHTPTQLCFRLLTVRATNGSLLSREPGLPEARGRGTQWGGGGALARWYWLSKGACKELVCSMQGAACLYTATAQPQGCSAGLATAGRLLDSCSRADAHPCSFPLLCGRLVHVARRAALLRRCPLGSSVGPGTQFLLLGLRPDLARSRRARSIEPLGTARVGR
jgi:hypothetical protein